MCWGSQKYFEVPSHEWVSLSHTLYLSQNGINSVTVEFSEAINWAVTDSSFHLSVTRRQYNLLLVPVYHLPPPMEYAELNGIYVKSLYF